MPYRHAAPVVLLLVSALVLTTGCSSGGGKDTNKASAKTGESMDALIDRLNASQAQLDATIAAMNAIEPAENRAAAYKAFTAEVKQTEKMAEQSRKRANQMRKQGASYFDSWTAQSAAISNPEMKALAEQRVADLQKRFDEIKNISDAGKDSFESFMESLYDIQLFLGSDLTPAGIGAVKPYMDKATQDAEDVKESIDAIIEEIEAVRELLSPGSGAAQAEG